MTKAALAPSMLRNHGGGFRPGRIGRLADDGGAGLLEGGSVGDPMGAVTSITNAADGRSGGPAAGHREVGLQLAGRHGAASAMTWRATGRAAAKGDDDRRHHQKLISDRASGLYYAGHVPTGSLEDGVSCRHIRGASAVGGAEHAECAPLIRH